MSDEHPDPAENAQTLGAWRNLIVCTACHPGALQLWLYDERPDLLEPYVRAALARLCAHLKRAIAFWGDGADGAERDSAAVELTRATEVVCELAEILTSGESQPLIALLRLGSEAITAVGYDIALANGRDEEPF